MCRWSCLVSLLLLFPASAHAAPLPGRGQTAPSDLCGRWRARWNGIKVEVVFLPDGRYRYERFRRNELEVWVGTWRLDGDAVHITERPDFEGSITLEWHLRLGRDVLARPPGGGEILRLVRRVGWR
jgi:hypothetical protein